MKLNYLARWTVLGCVGLVFGQQAPPVFAQTSTAPIVFSEDFSGDLSKWYSYRNGSMWSIVDGKVEAYVPNRSSLTELIPKDEYWNSDWKNYLLEYDMTPLQGVDRNTLFGFQDPSNWYEVHFVEWALNVAKVVTGTVPFSGDAPYHLVNGQTYRVAIKFNEGQITISVNGQQIFDQLDHTFADDYGRIGLKAGTGAVYPTRVQFDNVVVRWLDGPAGGGEPVSADIKLAVPYFSQLDDQWRTDEYDTARNWSSSPTIGRWGCLTTSMAMIMNYHGLTHLPDGQLLTPASLNNWLKSQVDGYVGEGAFNWIAASRLSRLISERYGTPKLEYLAHQGAELTTAIQEIMAGKPSVLQIEGHFLVATGLQKNAPEAAVADIYINDPAYDYQKLSQHQQPLLSTRTLQPSHTDLSYLLLTHSPNLQVKVTDAQGLLIPGWQTINDQLSDQLDGSGEVQPPLVIEQLAKPSDGDYYIQVWQPDFGSFELGILAYDRQANPTSLNQQGVVGEQPLTFKIEYRSDQAATVKEQLSLDQFAADADFLIQSQLVLDKFTQQKLSILRKHLSQAQHHQNYQMFWAVLEGLLKQSPRWLSPAVKEYLNRYLALKVIG